MGVIDMGVMNTTYKHLSSTCAISAESSSITNNWLRGIAWPQTPEPQKPAANQQAATLLLPDQILAQQVPSLSSMSGPHSTVAKAPVYVKIPNVPCLYRNTRTGNYYAEKKVKGKRREKSLGTADRKIAERRLKEWITNLDKVDVEVEKTTLRHLFQSFIKVTQGKSDSSKDINNLVLGEFAKWWPHGMDTQVRSVRPSQIEEWLALQEQEHKNSTYNRYAGVLRQVFEQAVNDRIIAESPFDRVRTKSKRRQTPVRRVPSVDQLATIVQSVRTQPGSAHAEDSADFLEFLGLAGIGQAEASSLTWEDVDFANGQIHFRRHKTDQRFKVPIYEHLKPLLEKLRRKAGSPVPAGKRVLQINDAKKALRNACVRLKLPHYSQRNLRQCLIRRLWQAGVDKKLIARYQGHQDGGQLIINTYTEVFGTDDALYERQQLAKLAVPKEGTPGASKSGVAA